MERRRARDAVQRVGAEMCERSVRSWRTALLALLIAVPAVGQSFVNFETGQVRPLALAPDGIPVWQGTVSQLRFGTELTIFRLWRIQPDDGRAVEDLAAALAFLQPRYVERPQDGARVLLLGPVGAR